MRVGVPNFEPARLAEALKFKLVTKSKLASEIDKTPAAITSYLTGQRSPSFETFDKICTALEQPKKFFLTRALPPEAEPALKNWRSISTKRSADRLRGESLLEWTIEIHSIFKNIFDLPRFELVQNLSDFDVPANFMDITLDHVEFAAKKLREVWGLGELPIKNLVRTAEKAGIVVSSYDLNVPQLDAVSTYYGNVPYVLLNTFKQSGSRGRFDLAHEIGHLLLHRNVSAKDLEGKAGQAIYKRLEEQAHWFAGALLLPANRFANDLWAPTFKCFEDMKAKWKVSIQAMMHRALDLQLLTETQYNWLNIAVSKRNARAVEPLDDLILREKIRLLPKCFERYEEEFGKSGVIDLLEKVPFSDELLEKLCDLGDGYIAERRNEKESDSDNLIRFDFRKKSS